jgi:hypothetical protein
LFVFFSSALRRAEPAVTFVLAKVTKAVPHSQIQFPKTKITLSGFNRKLVLLYSRTQTVLIQTG